MEDASTSSEDIGATAVDLSAEDGPPDCVDRRECLFQDTVPSPSMPSRISDVSSTPYGSSCHQCKSRRSVAGLSFCGNIKKRPSRSDSPHDDSFERSHCCRKKYCDVCLKKFYGEARSPIGSTMPWQCPSCRLICSCAACRRQRFKARNVPEHLLGSTSPATTLACSIVYFGNELGGILTSDHLNLDSSQDQQRRHQTGDNATLESAPEAPAQVVSFATCEVVSGSLTPRPNDGIKRTRTNRGSVPKKRKAHAEDIAISATLSKKMEPDGPESEVTAEAAILLASLRTAVPGTISAG